MGTALHSLSNNPSLSATEIISCSHLARQDHPRRDEGCRRARIIGAGQDKGRAPGPCDVYCTGAIGVLLVDFFVVDLCLSLEQVLKLLPVATLAQQLPRITRIIASSCADKVRATYTRLFAFLC